MFATSLLLALAPPQEAEYPEHIPLVRPYRGKGLYERLTRPAWGYPQPYHPKPVHQDTASFQATVSALRWLARNQGSDGSWNPGQEEFRAAVTGLALLAFLTAGHTHACTESYGGPGFGDVLRRGLQWILIRQDLDGCIGPRGGSAPLLNAMICAHVLSEAYGRSGSLLLLDPAERAIQFTLDTLTPDSVTAGWAALAIRSSLFWRSSFRPPASAVDSAGSWFSRVLGAQAEAGSLPTETAAAVCSLLLLDPRKADRRLAEACDRLLVEKPSREEGKIDLVYWHWGTLALFHYDGPSGSKWNAWRRALNETLLPRQHPKERGDDWGSWDPAGHWSSEGGRAGITALGALTLEPWARFGFVFFGR